MSNVNIAVDFLKDTREKLNDNLYNKGGELEEDFNKSLDLVWKKLDDLYKEDLTELYETLKFLIDEVCKLHEDEESPINKELFENNLNVGEICQEIEDGKKAFNIYGLNDPSWDQYLIGDIHSDTISTRKIIEKTDFFNSIASGDKIRLIFLGDYVDRGKAHLRTIQYILTLKYLFSQNIILQQGNHDGGSFKDGEVKMWVRKPEKDPKEDWFLLYLYKLAEENKTFPLDIIDDSLRLFDSLSNVSFMCYKNKTIFLTHGGIPRARIEEEDIYSHLSSISSLTDETIKDHLGKTIVQNMIWSDPATDVEDLRHDNGRFRFTQEHFEELRNILGFDILVRGHQVQEKGYKHFFDDRLVNIFSSGKIMEDGKDINRETAYSRVIRPHIINVDSNGGFTFIDLNS